MYFFSGKKLNHEGHIFYRHSTTTTNKIHWRCSNIALHCAVRLHTDENGKIITVRGIHNELCLEKFNSVKLNEIK